MKQKENKVGSDEVPTHGICYIWLTKFEALKGIENTPQSRFELKYPHQVGRISDGDITGSESIL